MAERNHHVIGRQILELDVPSIARAPAVQEAAAQRLRALDMTELEALFDRLAAPGVVMRLERVDIDLGDLCGADWQDQFERQLVERLTYSLEQTAERTQKQAAPESGPGAAFEQYVFFLRHGRLPWWGETPPQDWLQQILQALEPHQWQALQLLLAEEVRALHRLIHTVDDATLGALLDIHAGLPETQRLLDLWRPADQLQTSYGEWRLQFWLAVLNARTDATAGTHSRGVAVMRRLLELHSMFAAPEPRVSALGARAPQSTPDLPQPWREWLAEAQCDSETPYGTADSAKAAMQQDNALDPQSHVQVARTDETPPTGEVPPLTGAQRVDSDRAGEAPADDRIYSTRASPVQSSTQREAATEHGTGAMPKEGEAIYLNGAGCVILHPFLEELFRSNDLLAGRAFRDAAAREHAVRLFAYLTFGDELTPEYDLLLPKLLCGMAWEDPLALIEFTDAERTACDQLLGAVLTHWSALKSNSVGWMRAQFFLRSAKLEQLDSNWRLTVERRAQDVLLDRLPWGLGVIRLPWMQAPVYVHWMK